MKRIQTTLRHDWQQSVETLGFGFHTTDIAYWDESVYYSLGMDEVIQIETATQTLWDMCLAAVEHVIARKLYHRFDIPAYITDQIEKSWHEDHPGIYGRFDLCYRDGEIKMLEFNADTPTALFETAVVQWHWLQEVDPTKDQFNSLHEKLIQYWSYLKTYLYREPLYFSCMRSQLEDFTTTEYMRDCAIQAGLDTRFIFIDEIGWDSKGKVFADKDAIAIHNIFKLYPWEMMLTDDFGPHIPLAKNQPLWIEPSWKMLLSSKAILPILWQLFPGHKLLLEASFEKNHMTSYAEKPIWSREGSNILIYEDGIKKQETRGDYGANKTIYQSLFELPDFDGKYPVIGSWIIGQEPAGIGIRESDTLITTNTSRFVPHMIADQQEI